MNIEYLLVHASFGHDELCDMLIAFKSKIVSSADVYLRECVFENVERIGFETV